MEHNHISDRLDILVTAKELKNDVEQTQDDKQQKMDARCWITFPQYRHQPVKRISTTSRRLVGVRTLVRVGTMIGYLRKSPMNQRTSPALNLNLTEVLSMDSCQ